MRHLWIRRPYHYGFLALLVAFAACTVGTVAGPSPPAIPTISSVVVMPLESGEGRSRTISDPAKIHAVLSSYAFSQNGWIRADAWRIVPLYRIDFRTTDRGAAVYWLGSNSHPPAFPCYALCTGWWVAASGPAGDLDRTRYKPLPDAVSPFLLRDLDLP
jgi:hypothetical protein